MLDRLNQAMEHIESHLDQPIDVAGLAHCPADADNPVELFPSPGRPCNAICTSKA
ncbi:hypothetical protein ACFYQ5_22620 [Streptomyces sp. NPDC005794]|uniref:hypothetical protein n=1 Tax=Streptomyces sp. NPDC005794 TaxID=3364733 RepID=UPI0036938CF2